LWAAPASGKLDLYRQRLNLDASSKEIRYEILFRIALLAGTG
jgi:hypothetical protein